MPSNFKRVDLRVVKTHKVLVNALLTLLKDRPFSKITVNDLCEEALVSRAAFYSHFSDKYSLLKYWIGTLRNEFYEWQSKHTKEQLEELIYQFMQDNTKIIIHLLSNCDSEIWEILFNHMVPKSLLPQDGDLEKTAFTRSMHMNYCVGGMISILIRQAENHFRTNNRIMISEMIRLNSHLLEWREQKK